jgi:hypothetical protein
VNNSDKNDVLLRDPSSADLPVWILPSQLLGLLQQSDRRDCEYMAAGNSKTDVLTSKNRHTALATRFANFSRVIVL